MGLIRGIADALSGALVVALLAAAPAEAQATPTVGRFSATHSLPAAGGTVALTWRTFNASACTVAASPSVAGLPRTVPCSQAATQVALPANLSRAAINYAFTLTAGRAGAASATATAKTAVLVAPLIRDFTSTAALPATGGTATLAWATAAATSCTVAVSPAVLNGSATAPCSTLGASFQLPGNGSANPTAYTFTLTAAGPGGTVVATVASVIGGTAPDPLISTSTAETLANPAQISAGDQFVVTFNQAVAVDPGFSLTLTDGTSEGTIGAANATQAVSSAGANIVTLTLTDAPTMTFGEHLAGANLEILDASGITGVAAGVGSWNLIFSGRTDIAGDASPVVCRPVNSRVFGGTNCLRFATPSAGPIPPTILDVIAPPAPDLPGPIRTGSTGQPVDVAPEVITDCFYDAVHNMASTDTVYDAFTGAVLGSQPCGTVWDEADIGNTTAPNLNYMPTPDIAEFEQVAVIETFPGTLWVSGTALPPHIVAATRAGPKSVTFVFSTPVTCPAGTSAPDAAAEATQFTWYAPSSGDDAFNGYRLHYASSITCPPAAGGLTITATFGDPSIGLPPPEGEVTFKYDVYGRSLTSGLLLVPVGGRSSSVKGERAPSQSFTASL